MDDERWARLEAKRDQNRYFMGLETAALESQKHPAKTKVTKAKAPKKKAETKISTCRECGRTMRHGGSAEKFPDTVVHSSKGYCHGCYVNAMRRQARKRKRKDARPVLCKSCNIILRDAKEAPRPGTALHFGRGLCDTCGRRAREYVKSCLQCSIPMRPSGALLEEWPGTRQHFAKGLCQRCAQGNQERAHHLASGLTKCAQCSIVIRSSARSAEDYDVPTRRAGKKRTDDGGHLCTVCAYVPKGKAALAPCIDCGAPLVTRTAEMPPGHKRHAGGGRCGGCKSRARKDAMAG